MSGHSSSIAFAVLALSGAAVAAGPSGTVVDTDRSVN